MMMMMMMMIAADAVVVDDDDHDIENDNHHEADDDDYYHDYVTSMVIPSYNSASRTQHSKRSGHASTLCQHPISVTTGVRNRNRFEASNHTTCVEQFRNSHGISRSRCWSMKT